ncbi:hypothetical protein ACFQMA_09160 [Halosimplex aquaticum]|uniref:Uncharacterized protein n=1 Tax=Halosimplex aquaticum TaxID=3026162 RepID=A0ABD5Y190_9EURY|nr:hypothetical protein [Halosimplex aquaticum]
MDFDTILVPTDRSDPAKAIVDDGTGNSMDVMETPDRSFVRTEY